MDDFYNDLILELNRNPLNKKKINGISYRDKNPLCGDEIEIFLNFEKNTGVIKDVGFEGHGCALSQASASLITEFVKGKKPEEIAKMNIDDVLKELGIENVKNNPVRIKCVMLPLKAVKMAAFIYLAKGK